MKKKDNISLESIMDEIGKMDDRFKEFILVDKEWKEKSDKWKEEMEERIKPILAERQDYTIVMKWWKGIFHLLAIAIGFILSVAALIQIFITFFYRR